MTTKREKAYMSRVAAQGCIVCRNSGFGETPALIHHIREGQGGSQRAPNWLVLPLCPEHHVGKDSIHGDRHGFEMRYGSELDLLAQSFSEVWK